MTVRSLGAAILAGMVARADTVYLDGLDFFTGAVARVGSDQWLLPSPCSGWSALDVLGHVGVATSFGARLLRDESTQWQPSEPPGAAVEGDPPTWWAGLASEARTVVRGVDLARVVDSPMGRRTVAEGLTFPAVDLFVHGRDLGRAVGADLEIPAAVIEFAHIAIDRIPAEQVRSPRVFAQPVPMADGASPSARFLAWTGRDPNWQA